jgi:hypothetical protein
MKQVIAITGASPALDHALFNQANISAFISRG